MARKLPPYLFFDKHAQQYRYRRPDTLTYHWMGGNRQEAIDAANQLNQQLMAPVNLVDSVMGKTQTLNHFLETRFVPYILTERRLAEKTYVDYMRKIKIIKNKLGLIRLPQMTVKMISDYLLPLPPTNANRHRALLRLIFRYAIAEGWMEKNPAADTMTRAVEKQRRRLKYEEFLEIYRHAEPWLKNAMDLALVTLQRREDILNMKFEDIKEGWLYVVQQKTKKHGDAAYLQIELSEKLKAIINRCRDGEGSKYLVHWKAKRKVTSSHRDDQMKVLPSFLSHAFSKIRDELPIFKDVPRGQRPSFHEIRALGINMYEKLGTNAQKLAGHTDRKMTEVYMQGHEIQWTVVQAGLPMEHV